jgi:hypothetical protein
LLGTGGDPVALLAGRALGELRWEYRVAPRELLEADALVTST